MTPRRTTMQLDQLDSNHSLPRILLVEDDRKFASQVQEYLAHHFFAVEVEHDGGLAVERVLRDRPDIVLLDLMLPGMDGIAILRAIRDVYRGRVLMLTASHSEADHVAGLEVGADDFVSKPVVPRVLLARIRALLRRDSPASPAVGAELGRVVRGVLVVDTALREATYGGTSIPLTGAEFEVLRLLATHAGSVISRELLCRRVRGIEYDGIDRAIDIHVARIRRKLELLGASRSLIKAIRGEGYIMAVRR